MLYGFLLMLLLVSPAWAQVRGGIDIQIPGITVYQSDQHHRSHEGKQWCESKGRYARHCPEAYRVQHEWCQHMNRYEPVGYCRDHRGHGHHWQEHHRR
jgi:hypothetical protein